MWSGVFKQITLFYLWNKAQDALEALNLVAPVVFKIVIWNYFLFWYSLLCNVNCMVMLILPFKVYLCPFSQCTSVSKTIFTNCLNLLCLNPSHDCNDYFSSVVLTTLVNPSLWIYLFEEAFSLNIFLYYFLFWVFYICIH